MRFISFGLLFFVQFSNLWAQESESLEPPPDPFANEEPVEELQPLEPSEGSSPQQPVVPTTPPSSAPVSPAPSNSSSRPRFSDPFKQSVEEPAPSSAPSLPTPAPAFIPSPEEASPEQMPKKSFEFPSTVSNPSGPKSQEVVMAELSSQSTAVGTFSLGFSGGGAFNVNRRNNQAVFDFIGDYRWKSDKEFGVLLTYRDGGDRVLGFMGTYKQYFRVSAEESVRIEIAPMAAMGWAGRARSGKFNEGRFLVRYGAETFFYAYPKFALTLSTEFESFVFGYDAQSNWSQYFTNGGWPTQLIVALGVRFHL